MFFLVFFNITEIIGSVNHFAHFFAFVISLTIFQFTKFRGIQCGLLSFFVFSFVHLFFVIYKWEFSARTEHSRWQHSSISSSRFRLRYCLHFYYYYYYSFPRAYISVLARGIVFKATELFFSSSPGQMLYILCLKKKKRHSSPSDAVNVV